MKEELPPEMSALLESIRFRLNEGVCERTGDEFFGYEPEIIVDARGIRLRMVQMKARDGNESKEQE